MENLIFEEVEQPITPEDLFSLEKKMGMVFPESFKSHYLQNNGGYPPYSHVIGEDEQCFPISEFFPIKYGEQTAEELLEDYKEFIPELSYLKFFPFADDIATNIFFINLNEDNYGKVYLWRADTNVEGFEERLTYICISFESFIDNLTDCEEYDEEED